MLNCFDGSQFWFSLQIELSLFFSKRPEHQIELHQILLLRVRSQTSLSYLMQHCFLGRVLSLLLLTFLLFTAIPLKLLPPLVEGFQITFSVLPKHKIVMHHRFDSQAVSCSNYCFTLKASSSFLFHRDLLRSRPLNCGDL